MKLNKSEINELKKMFLACCAVDNPSREEDKMVKWVIEELKKIRIDAEVDNVKNVYAKKKGNGESVLLNAHLDAVQPCIGKQPQFDGRKFTSNGKTILGADNAAGLVSILYCLQYFKKHKIKSRPVEMLFTSMEELGGFGVKSFDFSKLDSKKAVVIDSLSPVGHIVTTSPAKYNFSIFFHGKAEHSQQIERGVSVIKPMAEVLAGIPIGRIKKGVTLNVGKVRSGSAVNTVAGDGEIKGRFKIFSEGEIRAEVDEEAKKLIEKISTEIKKAKKKYPKAKIDFEYRMNRAAYSFSFDDNFIEEIKEAMRESDLRPKEKNSFGVSDANTLNAMSIKSVLIGTGVENAHTTKEWVSLRSLVKLTEVLIHFCSVE